MAENTPPQPTLESDPIRYWCYHCDKRVAVETLPDIICVECRNGFVESISGGSPSPPPHRRNSSFNHQFLQVLRLIANAARDEDSPDPISDPSGSDDFLRIEFEDWENNEEDEEEQDENEDHALFEGYEDQFRSEINENEGDENQEGENEGDSNRTRQRLLRIRDFRSHVYGPRNRDLDWSEILQGLEDNTIELRVEMPDISEGYVGNPSDYVDATGYEVLLQDFLDNDGGTRRGAPPAARSVVSGLPTVEITQISEGEGLICAVCKELVSDGGLLKKLPCEHIYHADCIIPWLDLRNSCPVCRFELPTDDADYEKEAGFVFR